MGRIMKSALFFAFMLVLAVACSTIDDEPAPQDTKAKLVNKTWYKVGKNGQDWVLYKSDGSWESSSGDGGSWTLLNSKTLKIRARQDLLENWEEDILVLEDSYLKTKVKGVNFAKEYQTAP